MYPLQPYREAVAKAIAADKLKQLASKANDPDALLGCALLAQPGDPVRKELSDLALQAKPEFAPVIAVLPLMLDGVDEGCVAELIKCDPNNALGHYLRAQLLYQSDHASEALNAFRKAGRCPEMRLYDAVTANALFKALDEVNLKGEDRLCALSWMASRVSNFSCFALQPLRNSVYELAKNADLTTRKEVSDLLLVLAGHLFATNYVNRWHGERAAEMGLQLKAEVAAAENSPTMYGYGAAAQAIFNTNCAWWGFEDLPKPQQLAHFLPSRIFRAFAVVDPEKFNGRYIGELNFSVSESDRPKFEHARENAAKAARALLDVALTDPDGILGAYLKGIPSPREGDNAWLPQGTFVGKLMSERPELLKAAAANEKAMSALWDLGSNDPERQNIVRMMEIGRAISSYASAHENIYPENLDVLYREEYLNRELEAKSVLTGKPYIYVAGSQKRPAKSADLGEMVLLYDDCPSEHGYVPCVLASWAGSQIRLEDLQAQLRNRSQAMA